MAGSLHPLWTKLGIPIDYAQTRGLPVQREATRLTAIARTPDRRIIRLTPRAATAWKRLQAAAATDGVNLVPLSGFRSVARQTKIIRRKLARGLSISTILQANAAPGCSEHHTGRALDLGSPEHLQLEETFGRTREYRWLKKYAASFGFHLSYPRKNPHGIGYEPWHWCWSPASHR